MRTAGVFVLASLFWWVAGCHDSAKVNREEVSSDSSNESFDGTDTEQIILPRRPEYQPEDTADTEWLNMDTDTVDKAVDTGTEPAETWTMMFYMDADSNLEADMLLDLEEVSRVVPPAWLTILVLFDRHLQYDISDGNWTGTRLFKVNPAMETGLERLADSSYLGLLNTGDNDELDMGDPDTLERFMDYAMNTYSADHYGLVISGHGNGWTKKATVDAPPDPKLICTDDSGTSNGISIQGELAPMLVGRGIDVLGFDACLMGMVEVAWAVKDSVQYMVASEGNEASYGWDYLTWLSNWIADEPTPRALALQQVAAYQSFHEVWDIAPWLMTMTAVDTAKLAPLGDALDAFVANTNVIDYIYQAMTFDDYYDYYYDLMHLAQLAGDENLQAALKAAIIANWNSDNAAVPGGLSIFFFDGQVYEYQQTSFCIDLDWC